MGMAASQARLLAITARIHDVETEAQAIQNAKIQLSTQSDQVYNEYLEALDAETLTLNIWNAGSKSTTPITANFMNLCSTKCVESADGTKYALRDDRGRLVVEQNIYEAYRDFEKLYGNNDPYAFAMFMMTGTGNAIGNESEEANFNKNLQAAEESAYSDLVSENPSDSLKIKHDSILTLLQTNAPKEYEVQDIYDTTALEKASPEVRQECRELLESYKYDLYRRNAGAVQEFATEGSYKAADFDWSAFNKYAEIYKQIKHCGGCISINEFNGSESGNAALNSDWLQAVIRSGKFSIESYSVDKATGKLSMNGTSPSSDSSLSYTETTSIDKTALAKAEAKYEHDLEEINKKDKKFDLSLSKLESERTALTTEYDSVKKVIQDNIERTFGIFS